MLKKEVKMPIFSDYFLDQYLSGECSKNDVISFEKALVEDETLRIHFENFKLLKAKHRQELPNLAQLMSSHETSKNTASSLNYIDILQRWWLRGSALGLVTAICLFVLWLPESPKESQDDIRFKGNSTEFLEFYFRKSEVQNLQNHEQQKMFPGHNNMELYPGSQIQFIIQAKQGAYVAVVSKDASGQISEYAPAGEYMQFAKGEYVFQNSVILDDILGQERIYGLRCQMKYELEKLGAILNVGNDDALDWPKDCQVSVITLQKVSR